MFSDNTHRDVVNNALGIRNVWRGEYLRADGTRLTGPSLRDLVAGRDKAVAARLDVQMDAAVSAAEAIRRPSIRRSWLAATVARRSKRRLPRSRPKRGCSRLPRHWESSASPPQCPE